MDLLYPSRLVFHYERLMSLAFAMSARSINALLLGVGGAAMWRFMRAYLPDCAPTLVDSDETIIATARRWFYLKQPVVLDTAQRFLAGSSTRYDVILVDLYGSGGPAESEEAFWTRCLDALAPGGCLANNWADFAVNPKVRPMSDSLSAVARARGFEPIYVTRRGFRDNLVQYVPTGTRDRRRSHDRCSRTPRPGAPHPRSRPRHPRKLHRRHPLPDRLTQNTATKSYRGRCRFGCGPSRRCGRGRANRAISSGGARRGPP